MRARGIVALCVWFGLILLVANVAGANAQDREPPILANGAMSLVQQVGENLPGTHAKPPIVMVHGWQGANIGLECQRHDLAYVDNNWDRLDEGFEALGFHVELARLYSGGAMSAGGPGDPNWHCTPPVEENVPNLIEAIDLAIAATGQPKVILVGHSMGGLVSRGYLEGADYRGDVAAVYTLGTPHIGVPVDALSTWVEIITLGLISLDEYCEAQPVVCQFSDNESDNPPGFTGIETFNANHSQRADGVYYHMLSGDINFDYRSILCDPIYLIVGVANDCIVPLDSAFGSGSADGSLGPLSGPIDRLEVFAAHISTFSDEPSIPFTCDYRYNFHDKNEYCVNLIGISSLNRALLSNSFTDCVAPSLDNRLGSHTCGTVSDLSSAINEVIDTGGMVRTPAGTGTLTTNQSTSQTYWLNGGQALFVAFHGGNALTTSLIAPDGTVYTADSVGEGMTYKEAEGASGFMLEEAMAGEWQFVLTANNTPTNYLAYALHESATPLQINLDQDTYRPGDTATLNITAWPNADLQATLNAQGEQNLTLSPAGDNLYRATLTIPNNPGYAQISVTSQDLAEPSQYALRLFTIDSELSLTGVYDEQNTENGLVVSVGIEAGEPGRVGLSADLVGRETVHTYVTTDVQAGQNAVELVFADVPAGEWQLTNLILSDLSRGGIVTDEAKDALLVTTTAPPSSLELSPTPPEIDDSPHTCDIDNLGPYLPGNTINLNFDITLIDEEDNVEWLDYYFVDGPDAWNVTSQSPAPADVGGWGRAVTETGCNPAGLAYWGIENPYLAPLASECDLGLASLPTSGSHNGPWLTDEPNGLYFQESFEGAFPPAGWTSWDTDGDGYNTSWQASSSLAYDGTFSAFHNDDSTCFFCTGDIESWLVMPQRTIRSGDELVFYQQWQGSVSGFGSDFDVWVSQGSNNPSSGDFIELFDLPNANGSWESVVYDLTEHSGDTVYIAFRYLADDDEELYLDNIHIRNQIISETTYEFDLSYVVDTDPVNSCPGSPFVGVSSDPNDPRAGLQGIAMGDLVDYSVNTASCDVAQACPLPAVNLIKTVSTDGSCPGTDAVLVTPSDQTVTFCFEVENTSTNQVTLTDYVIDDPDIGLNNVSTPPLTLAPGEQAVVFQIDHNYGGAPGQCFNNGATVTAFTQTGLGQPQGGGADVPFIDTTYSAFSATPPDATEVCIQGPTAISLQTVQLSSSTFWLYASAILALLATGTLAVWRRRT